jgi:hypothetical protein
MGLHSPVTLVAAESSANKVKIWGHGAAFNPGIPQQKLIVPAASSAEGNALGVHPDRIGYEASPGLRLQAQSQRSKEERRAHDTLI